MHLTHMMLTGLDIVGLAAYTIAGGLLLLAAIGLLWNMDDGKKTRSYR